MASKEDHSRVEISVKDMVDFLVNLGTVNMKAKKSLPSGMAWGPPGIGKTFGILDAAKQIGDAIGEEVRVHEFLMSTLEPSDMAGIFEKEEKAEISLAKVLPVDWAYEASDYAKNKGPLILFFDDLPVAHPQTQAACFKVIHQRMCGDLKFRDNVWCIAAGNRPEDNAGASEMLTALANRFFHMNIRVDTDSWLKWATDHRLNPMALAFLRKFKEHLWAFDTDQTEPAFPTPRSWHMLCDMMDSVGHDPGPLFNMATGVIGRGVSTQLVAFVRSADSLVDPEEIVKAPKTARVPTMQQIDSLYATTTILERYIKDHPTQANFIAAITYSLRKEMNREMGTVLAGTALTTGLEVLNDEDQMDFVTHEVLAEALEKFEIGQ